MNKNIKKTQHFSTDNQLITNLIEDIPNNVPLIEPFCGTKALMQSFPNHKWEYYDIDDTLVSLEHCRDTLINIPNYKNKWVITNPPYLAKNKATNHDIFNLYPKYDDLYKIAIHTILSAEGGILIIPVNFFADEKSKLIRQEFFDNFEIIHCNIFTEQMFEYTAYNVCSFSFMRRIKKDNLITFPVIIFPQKEEHIITLDKQCDWRIGGQYLKQIKNAPKLFTRLTKDNPNPKGYITNIKIICIDKTNEPLHFTFDEPYYGLNTDRTIATLVSSIELSLEMQEQIIKKANQLITNYRQDCFNLCFTNYRDRNRKRMGFKVAYDFASLSYNLIKGN